MGSHTTGRDCGEGADLTNMVGGTDRVFDYGPLRDAKVRRSVFGRDMPASSAVLTGYSRSSTTSHGNTNPTLKPSYEDSSATVKGVVFFVAPQDLTMLDYWYQGYVRFVVTLGDQAPAWAYYYAGDIPGYDMPQEGVVKLASAKNRPKTGPEAIAAALAELDMDHIEKEAYTQLRSGKKTGREEASKRLQVVHGLRRNRITPADLVLDRIPVVPVDFRPYTVMGDMLMLGDVNELYQDYLSMVEAYEGLRKAVGDENSPELQAFRPQVYDSAKALFGYGPPITQRGKERNTKGFLNKILGTGPKYSFVSRKLVSKPQDFVARGVIGIDPSLGMDEIGVPEDQAWSIYSITGPRELVKAGVNPAEATLEWEGRTDRARKIFEREVTTRPVYYNRAPVWHRHGIVAGKVRVVPGNQILINQFVTAGLNADFDGDEINVHALITPESVADAKERLFPSKAIFSIRDRQRTMLDPKHEAVLGATVAQTKEPNNRWNAAGLDDALKMLTSGQARYSDEFNINI